MLFRGHVEAKNNWPPFLAKNSEVKESLICSPASPRRARAYVRIINRQLLWIPVKGGHTDQQKPEFGSVSIP